MVILSTLVSAIVEWIFQLKDRRHSYFNEVMSRFFEEVIWRKLQKQIERTYGTILKNEDSLDFARKEYLKVMNSVTGLSAVSSSKGKSTSITSSLFGSGSESSQIGMNREKDKTNEWSLKKEEFMRNFLKPVFWKTEKKTERLTSVEFAYRFAKTRPGKIIYSMDDYNRRVVVEDLLRRFDELSVGSTSDFRVRARKWSLWVGLFLVLTFNVDAVHLFQQLNNDPQLSKHLIAETSELLNELKESERIEPSHLEEINKAINGIDGLAVGWEYFPHCKVFNVDKDEIDNRCSAETVRDWIIWAFGIGSTTIFVGLGSPFWFQVFQRMSVAAQLARGFTSSKSQTVNVADSKSNAALSSPLYEEAVEAFVLSAKADAILPSEDGESRAYT